MEAMLAAEGSAPRQSMPVPQRRAAQRDSDPDDPFWTWGPALIAILPSIGFLVTGGDFVRDFLLFCLMLAFMFALIKTPWELYTSSRQRSLESLPRLDPSDERYQIRELARTELRFLEISYLCLSAASPLVGGWVLRMLARALTGDADLGWFNTTIFIIVAGWRPWSHLVDLLKGRTSQLQTIINHPDDSSAIHLEALNKRIMDLEILITQLQQDRQESTTTFKSIVDETVDDVQTLLRRQERKDSLARLAHESRLSAVEARFESMEKDFVRTRVKQRPPKWAMANGDPPSGSRSFLYSLFSFFISSPPVAPLHPHGRVSHSTDLPTVPEDEDDDDAIALAADLSATYSDPLTGGVGVGMNPLSAGPNISPTKLGRGAGSRQPRSKLMTAARRKPSGIGFIRDLFYGLPRKVVGTIFQVLGSIRQFLFGSRRPRQQRVA
jgi:hypothetical protein